MKTKKYGICDICSFDKDKGSRPRKKPYIWALSTPPPIPVHNLGNFFTFLQPEKVVILCCLEQGENDYCDSRKLRWTIHDVMMAVLEKDPSGLKVLAM